MCAAAVSNEDDRVFVIGRQRVVFLKVRLGEKEEKVEEIAGVDGMTQGWIVIVRRGEAIIGHGNWTPGRSDEALCQDGVLGLVFAIHRAIIRGRLRKQARKDRRSPSTAMDKAQQGRDGGYRSTRGIEIELAERIVGAGGTVGDGCGGIHD